MWLGTEKETSTDTAPGLSIVSSIMRNTLASATEAELAALFHKAQDDVPLCTTLI
jgi:hypothetical protein